jgi:hypothetical protein
MPARQWCDPIPLAFIHAPINSRVAGSGGKEISEFRRENIIGGRSHCGVCPWCRRSARGYEPGVQVGSAPMVRTRSSSR